MHRTIFYSLTPWYFCYTFQSIWTWKSPTAFQHVEAGKSVHGNTAIPPSLSHTSIQIASIVTKVTDFLTISLLRTFFYCSRFVFKMNRTRIADFCSMLYLARNENLQCKNLYCAFHLANCAILSHFAKQALELFQTLPLTRNRAIETYLIKAECPQRGMPPQQIPPE